MQITAQAPFLGSSGLSCDANWIAPDVRGQPPDVGRAPEHIVLMVVQFVFRR